MACIVQPHRGGEFKLSSFPVPLSKHLCFVTAGDSSRTCMRPVRQVADPADEAWLRAGFSRVQDSCILPVESSRLQFTGW